MKIIKIPSQHFVDITSILSQNINCVHLGSQCCEKWVTDFGNLFLLLVFSHINRQKMQKSEILIFRQNMAASNSRKTAQNPDSGIFFGAKVAILCLNIIRLKIPSYNYSPNQILGTLGHLECQEKPVKDVFKRRVSSIS